MEDTLKRLLTVESEAEQLVTKAQKQREQLIQAALTKVAQEEQDFQKSLPELQTRFLQQAEKQAEQAIAELEKRYQAKQTQLYNLAEENQQKALDAAIQLLMKVGL